MNKKTDTYKRLGDYIEPIDERNKQGKVKLSQGITNNKYFQNPRQVAVNSANDNIVRTGYFAYNRATTRNGEKISIALREGEDCTVSGAYQVFKVKDEEKLDSRYLMMWFRRPEFDRYVRYKSHGSAHEFFEFAQMCDVMLPVPSIARQRELVAQYEALTRRIRINEQTIATLEETAQALYRKMFVEGIDKENLPKGWRMGTLGEVAEYVTEKVDVKRLSPSDYVSAENMIKDFGGLTDCVSFPSTGKCTKYNVGDILLSNIRPYFKKMWLATRSGGCSNDVLNIRVKNVLSSVYLFYTLANDSFIDYVTAGSNGVKMPRGDKEWIMNYSIIIPSSHINQVFMDRCMANKRMVDLLTRELSTLCSLQSLLLTKLSNA